MRQRDARINSKRITMTIGRGRDARSKQAVCIIQCVKDGLPPLVEMVVCDGGNQEVYLGAESGYE